LRVRAPGPQEKLGSPKTTAAKDSFELNGKKTSPGPPGRFRSPAAPPFFRVSTVRPTNATASLGLVWRLSFGRDFRIIWPVLPGKTKNLQVLVGELWGTPGKQGFYGNQQVGQSNFVPRRLATLQRGGTKQGYQGEMEKAVWREKMGKGGGTRFLSLESGGRAGTGRRSAGYRCSGCGSPAARFRFFGGGTDSLQYLMGWEPLGSPKGRIQAHRVEPLGNTKFLRAANRGNKIGPMKFEGRVGRNRLIFVQGAREKCMC